MSNERGLPEGTIPAISPTIAKRHGRPGARAARRTARTESEALSGREAVLEDDLKISGQRVKHALDVFLLLEVINQLQRLGGLGFGQLCRRRADEFVLG